METVDLLLDFLHIRLDAVSSCSFFSVEVIVFS